MSTYRIVIAFPGNPGGAVKKCIASKVLSPQQKGRSHVSNVRNNSDCTGAGWTGRA